jgi:hypothetical protein
LCCLLSVWHFTVTMLMSFTESYQISPFNRKDGMGKYGEVYRRPLKALMA